MARLLSRSNSINSLSSYLDLQIEFLVINFEAENPEYITPGPLSTRALNLLTSGMFVLSETTTEHIVFGKNSTNKSNDPLEANFNSLSQNHQRNYIKRLGDEFDLIRINLLLKHAPDNFAVTKLIDYLFGRTENFRLLPYLMIRGSTIQKLIQINEEVNRTMLIKDWSGKLTIEHEINLQRLDKQIRYALCGNVLCYYLTRERVHSELYKFQSENIKSFFSSDEDIFSLENTNKYPIFYYETFRGLIKFIQDQDWAEFQVEIGGRPGKETKAFYSNEKKTLLYVPANFYVYICNFTLHKDFYGNEIGYEESLSKEDFIDNPLKTIKELEVRNETLAIHAIEKLVLNYNQLVTELENNRIAKELTHTFAENIRQASLAGGVSYIVNPDIRSAIATALAKLSSDIYDLVKKEKTKFKF